LETGLHLAHQKVRALMGLSRVTLRFIRYAIKC
jgi:hypothetical protein